jgi:hypothetical protein
MSSYGKWRRSGLVKTDVSEEHVVSIFMVEETYANEQKCRQFLGDTFLRTSVFDKDDISFFLLEGENVQENCGRGVLFKIRAR